MEGIGSRMLQVTSPAIYWVDLPLACCSVLLKWSESRSVVSDSLQPHGLYSPWNSPGQNTGVDSFSLLQGIFPTWGSNPGLPHCSRILYQLSHKGSPRIREWVAYPFSRRLPQPRNWTRVSCTAGRFFTKSAIREAQFYWAGRQIHANLEPVNVTLLGYRVFADLIISYIVIVD